MLCIGLIIAAQALYSVGDLMRKFILHGNEFGWGLLLNVPLLATMLLSTLAFAVQLYVLKHYDLGRTTVILGCTAVVFSTVLGAVFLKERFSLYDGIGVGFAVLAVIFTHIR